MSCKSVSMCVRLNRNFKCLFGKLIYLASVTISGTTELNAIHHCMTAERNMPKHIVFHLVVAHGSMAVRQLFVFGLYIQGFRLYCNLDF